MGNANHIAAERPHGTHRAWSSDQWGIFASVACLIHCLALPAFLSAIPIFFVGDADHFFHWLMLILIVPLTAYALIIHGYLRHRAKVPGILGAVGVAFLVTEVLLHELHVPKSNLLAPTGGLILIVGHILNIRACQRLTHCNRCP